MIDIHTHILPGVDDGARDLESALEMATAAVESGVQIMVASPHSNAVGTCPNYWGPKMIHRLKVLRRALKEAKIPLLVLPGMEIFGTGQIPELLGQKKLLGLNGSRYPLVEFPFDGYAGRATDILDSIRATGMVPVVAHPERYVYIQQNPSILNLWMEIGCLLQVNKGSLLGRFGGAAQTLAMELVRRDFVCAVASDAHSPNCRTARMTEVQQLLTEEFGPGTARKLLEKKPLRILKNMPIRQTEPEWF